PAQLPLPDFSAQQRSARVKEAEQAVAEAQRRLEASRQAARRPLAIVQALETIDQVTTAHQELSARLAKAAAGLQAVRQQGRQVQAQRQRVLEQVEQLPSPALPPLRDLTRTVQYAELEQQLQQSHARLAECRQAEQELAPEMLTLQQQVAAQAHRRQRALESVRSDALGVQAEQLVSEAERSLQHLQQLVASNQRGSTQPALQAAVVLRQAELQAAQALVQLRDTEH
ncbi:hypothetical protein HaLaN_19345, partial [Haematococcus lacustris]